VSIALRTLLYKELLRFWKVAFQTVAAPVLTALLYLLVFSHVLESHVRGLSRRAVHGVPDPRARDDVAAAERVREHVVVADPVEDHRQHRLHPAAAAVVREFYWAYVMAAVVRGMAVGAGVFAVTLVTVSIPLPNPLWALRSGCDDGGAILGQPRT
jgi:ABC-2 type transport system permease protein